MKFLVVVCSFDLNPTGSPPGWCQQADILLHDARTVVCVCDGASDLREYTENGETKTETTYTYSELFSSHFYVHSVMITFWRCPRSSCECKVPNL